MQIFRLRNLDFFVQMQKSDTIFTAFYNVLIL